MNFKCEICLSEFTQKIGLQKHLNKKNKCNTITDFQCKKCLKYFKHNRNLVDHTNKNTCIEKILIENKKETINNNEQNIKDVVKAIINSEKFDIDTKIELLKDYNLKISDEKLKKVIDSDLKEDDIIKYILTHINKASETTINNINNGTINANQTTNIQINNFGDEKIGYLDNEYFIKLLSTDDFENAFLKLTKEIYLRPDHPENKTVKIENLNNKFAFKYEDGIWKGILKSELKELLHDKNKSIIKVYLKSLENKNAEKINNYLRRNTVTDPFMKYLHERNILLLYTGKNKNEI
jgi:hypothetical protein